MSDSELILRIKAHNSGDSENGLQAWRCKRCTRGGTASVSGDTPAPDASPAPPRPQPISRQPSLRSVPPSESRQPTPVAQSVTHISNSSDVLPNAKGIGASQSRGGGRGHLIPPPPRRARTMTASRHSRDDIIVIDDSDSDSSHHAGSGPARTSAATTLAKKPQATVGKSAIRLSKTTHPLAQEEEESSDPSNRPPPLTKVPSRSTLNQPPQPTLSTQQPARAGVGKKVDNDPRKKPVGGGTNTAATSPQPLSKIEKETMRDQFRRNAAEKEKRRRLEHRQRQQQILQAKIEEKESIEGITLNVVDLDLNNNQQASVTPTEQVLQPTLAGEAVNPSGETTATTASVPNAKTINEPSFAFHWIGVRANGDDIWARALKKKESPTSPSTRRRKITARKLGDAQPQLFQFNASQWVDTAKGGRR